MDWQDSLNKVYENIIAKYGDLQEVTVPLEFSTDDMHPIKAMLMAFEWGHVRRENGRFIWQGNLKNGFPIFTDMVELLAIEMDKVCNE
jgi:hypothetical protein